MFPLYRAAGQGVQRGTHKIANQVRQHHQGRDYISSMSKKEFKKTHKAFKEVTSEMNDYKDHGGSIDSLHYQQLLMKANIYLNKLSPELVDKRYEAIFFNKKNTDQRINRVQGRVHYLEIEQKNHVELMKKEMRQFRGKITEALTEGKNSIPLNDLIQVMSRLSELEIYCLENFEKFEKGATDFSDQIKSLKKDITEFTEKYSPTLTVDAGELCEKMGDFMTKGEYEKRELALRAEFKKELAEARAESKRELAEAKAEFEKKLAGSKNLSEENIKSIETVLKVGDQIVESPASEDPKVDEARLAATNIILATLKKMMAGSSTVVAGKRVIDENNPFTWKGRVEIQVKLIPLLVFAGLGWALYEWVKGGKEKDLVLVNELFDATEDLRDEDLISLGLESSEFEKECKELNEKFKKLEQKVKEFNLAHNDGDAEYIKRGLLYAHEHVNSYHDLEYEVPIGELISDQTVQRAIAKGGFTKEVMSLTGELRQLAKEQQILQHKILAKEVEKKFDFGIRGDFMNLMAKVKPDNYEGLLVVNESDFETVEDNDGKLYKPIQRKMDQLRDLREALSANVEFTKLHKESKPSSQE